jgi:putative DNA primase/helicase
MLGRDSFFLARLVNGGVVGQAQADLSRVSEMFKPVAERLLAVAPEQRQRVWDDFLAGRLRPSPIVEAAPERETQNAASAQEPNGQPSADEATHDGESTAEPERRVRLTCAVNLQTREVEWLWAGRVPLGMITMFAGDPKLGKSYVTLSMAAAVSRGLPLPMSDVPSRAGSTILMSAEDDPVRTIVPRLTAAGADLTKIHILESVILANGCETLPSLRADIDAITAAATRLGDCRLIAIDPVSAYLKGVDDNRNAVLRGVLTPLKRLAERLGAAVVLVSHLTKGTSANGKHRVLGSIAYVGACRANHLFVADHRDPTGRRVLVLDNGGNVAPPSTTLAFVIEDQGPGPRVVWDDKTAPITVEEALRPQAAVNIDREQADERHECDGWLRSFLAQGLKSSNEVFKAGNGAGFSKDQIRRAKYRIGAVARKEGFDNDAQWSWVLPAVATCR